MIGAGRGREAAIRFRRQGCGRVGEWPSDEAGEDCLLGGEQFADPFFGVVEHGGELGAGVGDALGSGLGFDQAAIGEHDDVHVNVGAGVFLVGEVEQDVTVDDADRGGGDHLAQRRGFEGARGDQLSERKSEGDRGPGDGGGAGPTIGLEDVAVEDDGAFAERLHVDDGAQAAADEALDLVSASADLAALGLARGAGQGGAGKHSVLGGDPAAAGVAHPAGNAGLDSGVAQDAGVPGLDQDRTFGGGDEVWGEAHGAKGVGGSAIGTEELSGGWRRGLSWGESRGHSAIIVVQGGCGLARVAGRSLGPAGVGLC